MRITKRQLLCVFLIFAAVLSRVGAQDSSRGADNKLMVLITEGVSWKEGNGHPKTAEIIKTFTQKCPQLVITTDQHKEADYVVRLDDQREGEELPGGTQFVVFSKDSHTIYRSSKKPTLGDVIEGVCATIKQVTKRKSDEDDSSDGLLDSGGMEH